MAVGAPDRATQGVAPNDDVASIAKLIRSIDVEIMLIGHLGFLGRLTVLLTVGKAGR